MPPEILLVLTNLPDAASAEQLAHRVVNARLAACVNILAPCRSVYRWDGQVETATEVPLLMKTSRAQYAALEAEIRSAHPYSVPEIIALPVTAGLTEYLNWVDDSTRQPLQA
jgi:periplasmic divalent cation tolerance protein